MAKLFKTKEEIQQEKLDKQLSDLRVKDRVEFLTVTAEGNVEFNQELFDEKFGWIADDKSDLKEAVSKTKVKTLKSAKGLMEKLHGPIGALGTFLDQAADKFNKNNVKYKNAPVIRGAEENISKLQTYRVSLKNQALTLTEQISELKQQITNAEKANKSVQDKKEKQFNAKEISKSKKALKDARACKKKLLSLITSAGKALKKVKSGARHLGITSVKNVNGIASHVSALFDRVDITNLQSIAESDPEQIDSNAKKDIKAFQSSLKKALKETKARNKQLKTLIIGTADDGGADKADDLIKEAFEDIEESTGLFSYLDALGQIPDIETPEAVQSVEEAEKLNQEAASGLNDLGRLARKLSRGVSVLPEKIKNYKKKWRKQGISEETIKLMIIDIAARLSEKVKLQNSMDLSATIKDAKASCMVASVTYAAATVPFATAAFAVEDVIITVDIALMWVEGIVAVIIGIITAEPILIFVGVGVMAMGGALEGGALYLNKEKRKQEEASRKREAQLRKQAHEKDSNTKTATKNSPASEIPVKQQNNSQLENENQQHSTQNSTFTQ